MKMIMSAFHWTLKEYTSTCKIKVLEVRAHYPTQNKTKLTNNQTKPLGPSFECETLLSQNSNKRDENIKSYGSRENASLLRI